MHRRTLVWNILCGLLTSVLMAGIAPRLGMFFTTRMAGGPLWQSSWPMAFEGIFVVSAVAICGIAVSSLFAGRMLPARRMVAAVLAAGVLAAWVHSSMLWLEKEAAYTLVQPSLFSRMMSNDGMAFGAIATVFLLVPVVSGHGVFWWLRRVVAKAARPAQPS